MKIGVLALQGAFREHIQMLEGLRIEAIEVRKPEHLEGLDGLIIPGGESTTIGKLAVEYNLLGPLRTFAKAKPVWGTCAGMIFLSKDVRRDQPLLGVMDVLVERNAFGRQVDSFEADLEIKGIEGGSFPAIFIRAPRIEHVDTESGVQVLSTLADGTIVAARQGNLLAMSFHPELTGDQRLHRFFLSMVENTTKQNGR